MMLRKKLLYDFTAQDQILECDDTLFIVFYDYALNNYVAF